MVLVGVALVCVVHVPRLIPVMLVSVALVSIMLMLIGVVLVGVALVCVVHVPRLILMMLVTVTLVWIVDAHPILLPDRALFFRFEASTLRWIDSGDAPKPLSLYLISV